MAILNQCNVNTDVMLALKGNVDFALKESKNLKNWETARWRDKETKKTRSQEACAMLRRLKKGESHVMSKNFCLRQHGASVKYFQEDNS